jgi:hypothetical protein
VNCSGFDFRSDWPFPLRRGEPVSDTDMTDRWYRRSGILVRPWSGPLPSKLICVECPWKRDFWSRIFASCSDGACIVTILAPGVFETLNTETPRPRVLGACPTLSTTIFDPVFLDVVEWSPCSSKLAILLCTLLDREAVLADDASVDMLPEWRWVLEKSALSRRSLLSRRMVERGDAFPLALRTSKAILRLKRRRS